MKVVIDPRKSPQENANDYYEKSKKLRAKIPKLREAIKETEYLLKNQIAKAEIENQLPQKKLEYKREWYEKFHWAKLSDFLFLGGRDTKSNTELVKKYLEKTDLYFHADIDGAPSCVLKNGQNAPEKIREQAAVLAGAFSSAWKSGLFTVTSYHVLPEQVKASAKSGEYLSSGAFVIEGKRNWHKDVENNLEISFFEDKIMCAPVGFYDSKFVSIVPDRFSSKGDAAKRIFVELKRLFPEKKFELDWILQVLPNGGSKIKGVYQ